MMQTSFIKQIPNIFTTFRIICTPLLVNCLLLSLQGNQSLAIWAFGIFVFASLTDWVDGFLARALDAKSKLGAKLDLLADKLLVGLTIIGIGVYELLNGTFASYYVIPAIIFLIFATIIRDYFITNLRAKAEAHGFSMPATFIAKTKTAVIMVGMAIYLAAIAFARHDFLSVGLMVTFVGALMSIYTGIVYYNYYKANIGK